MTGTNSFNDRLILCQNVEINSNEYFSYHIFFGTEIVDHVGWKRHCTITKQNVFEFSVIPMIICGTIIGAIRCNSSFIHHLLRMMMSLSSVTEALFFLRCVVVLVDWMSTD